MTVRDEVTRLLRTHEEAERRLADILGGTPQSAARPPMVINGATYEALPTCLLDPGTIHHRFYATVTSTLTATDEEARLHLHRLAETVLTKEAVAALLAAPISAPMSWRSAVIDLASIVERMIEKGVI
jgi:hypothetical protein